MVVAEGATSGSGTKPLGRCAGAGGPLNSSVLSNHRATKRKDVGGTEVAF